MTKKAKQAKQQKPKKRTRQKRSYLVIKFNRLTTKKPARKLTIRTPERPYAEVRVVTTDYARGRVLSYRKRGAKVFTRWTASNALAVPQYLNIGAGG